MRGRAGDDILVGGTEADAIRTGSGADTIVFTDTDAIDEIFNVNLNQDDFLIAIAGVSSIAGIDDGADLDLVIDDGGIFDGITLATLFGETGNVGDLAVSFGNFDPGLQRVFAKTLPIGRGDVASRRSGDRTSR